MTVLAEPVVKTGVSLPRSLFEAAESAAKHAKMTRSALYADALRRELAHLGQDAFTEYINGLVATQTDQERAETDQVTAYSATRLAQDKDEEW
jgi:metal-responsive CopG/Arc/MetJ family transcriptional regulator